MTSATLEKEFYVETSDKIGTASNLTSVVTSGGTNNIKAMWGSSYGGKGHIYFIPENWSSAKQALSSSDYKNFREEEVVVAFVDNKPGTIYKLTEKFTKANININWFYTTSYDGKSAVVFSTSDNQKACQLAQQ